MNIEACQQTMHYGAMGIHLALVAHKGDSHLRRVLDDALRNQDWPTIQIIQSCFAALDLRERALILTGVGHPQKIADAIAHLEIKVYLQDAWKEIVQARKESEVLSWS